MKTKTDYIWASNKGFTLVELMVAMAMSIVMVTAIMTLTEMASRAYRNSERVTDAQQGARGGIDAMVRDIRMTGYDPLSYTDGPTTGVGITLANATELRFTADTNADQVIDDTMGGREEITYRYDSGTQKLSQIRYETVGDSDSMVTETLVDNVSGLAFTYLDAQGDETTDLDDIVLVVVNLTVTATDSKGVTYDRALVTSINCRNLRY